jgi:hypothetical protein
MSKVVLDKREVDWIEHKAKSNFGIISSLGNDQCYTKPRRYILELACT